MSKLSNIMGPHSTEDITSGKWARWQLEHRNVLYAVCVFKFDDKVLFRRDERLMLVSLQNAEGKCSLDTLMLT